MGIIELINRNWNEGIDPRVADLPLVKSNYLVPSIIIAYLYFVLKWGPNFMKDRKPYNLETFVRWYNVFQIPTNAYILIQFITTENPTKLCVVPDYSFDPIPVKIAYTIYLAWLSRFVDLIETVVFVLRKKDRQISFLHLYHHILIVSVGWYLIRFHAVQIVTLPMIMNCLVHVIMYTYYFFSTFGGKTPKIVKKMKPLITIMQMVQFILMLIYGIVSLHPSCPFPRTLGIIYVTNTMIMLALFYDFYRKTYNKQEKQKLKS